MDKYQTVDGQILCDCCKSRHATDHMRTLDGADQDVTIFYCEDCLTQYGATHIVLRFFGLTRREAN